MLPSQTSRRDLIRRFKQLGWVGPRYGAKHAFMQRGKLKVHIPNTDVHISRLRDLLRQAGISDEEWTDSA